MGLKDKVSEKMITQFFEKLGEALEEVKKLLADHEARIKKLEEK